MFSTYFIELKKENNILRSNLINILEKKDSMTLDEYDLYLSLQKIRLIKPYEKKTTIKYPPLPLSDDEN
jgi:hypothetical protein